MACVHTSPSPLTSTRLGAVEPVVVLTVADHATVFDHNLLALLLDLIQDTVGHLHYFIASKQLVGSQNRELQSSATAPVGQCLIHNILVRILVWSRLA